MEKDMTIQDYTLRAADASDNPTIHRMISQAHINPMGLDWHHFTLAVDRNGNIIGTGQLKPHSDGSVELASIAVVEEWRGRGVARAIIEHLLDAHPGTLYLTCRSELGPMYQKFGFSVVKNSDMPPYFKRISRVVSWMNRLAQQPVILLVMRRR